MMNCFAVVVPGLEGLVEHELKTLAAHDVVRNNGGVSFSGSMDALCRINLRARCITRVLVRLAEFKAMSFPELFNKCRKIPWEQYMVAGWEMDISASCHRSRLMHTGRVTQALGDAVEARLSQHAVTAGTGHTGLQKILVRLEQDVCVVSIDASGERLDRRGYRIHSGRAPIRETLAAGIVQWMNWRPDEALLVPMCGSGTFAIEAALMGQDRAANLAHDFAFLHWPILKPKRWQRILEKTTAMVKPVLLNIQASDIDPAIVKQAIANAEQADVAENIVFSQQDIRCLSRTKDMPDSGLIICNPPYGDRIKGDAGMLYRSLGNALRHSFQGWRAGVIVPDQACEKALGLPVVDRRLKVKHGGKWVHVLSVDLK